MLNALETQVRVLHVAAPFPKGPPFSLTGSSQHHSSEVQFHHASPSPHSTYRHVLQVIVSEEEEPPPHPFSPFVAPSTSWDQ